MTQTPSDQLPLSTSGRSAMDVALEAARLAGGMIRDRFSSTLQVSFKGRNDIVTDVDVAVEKAVLELVRREFPDFGILAEESQPVTTGSPYRWVVDPIDGTRNFAMGIPHFCTIVALSHGDEPVIGVTYDPMREELFTAEKGKGAFLNGERISVSETPVLSEALLCCDLGYVDEKAGLAIDMIRSIWPGMLSLRLLGSAGLGVAYAAAGRVDMYFHHSLSPWDIVAGLVQVREAGGQIVDKQGKPANLQTSGVIAANPTLIADFLEQTDGLPWRDT